MSQKTIVIAPDSFKECLPAWDVAGAIAEGWRRAYPDDTLICLPMADGGEGTAEVLVRATGGTRHTTTVTGPLGEPVEAAWGVLGDSRTAIIEMAAASGLHLVPPERRDPLVTTTRGTGELIAAALDAGCTTILAAVGGSATNDGGAGMASALGYRFLDAEGRELPDGGAALARLATVETGGLHAGLQGASITVLCDVTNPLLGPEGAAAVYGPQKGATPAMAAELDDALEQYARVVEPLTGKEGLRDAPGSGAAGGLAFGLMALLDAAVSPGFERVAELCGLERRLESANLVITGEGRLDGQTLSGKVCAGMAARAARREIPCIALAGSIEGTLDRLYEQGLTAAFALTPRPMPLDEAMANTAAHLEAAGENLARLWHARGHDD